MMHKLSAVVRFFALFSFIAGILIVISSVLATRSARIQQAVYYKILGARGVFVLQVFAIENIILGLSSALPALAVAQAGSWMISKTVLDIPYRLFPGISLIMTAASLLTIVTVGLLASIPILRQRPVVYLREQTEE
jgi:putative ABC transport system permease protein